MIIGGESLANPPLILRYGGSGMTEMRFFRVSQRRTETSKLVEVHYDAGGEVNRRRTPSRACGGQGTLRRLA